MRPAARQVDHYDRDTVVAATDLPTLLDRVLGFHRGRGGSATWPCPDPAHGPQTGRTPPVTSYLAHGVEQRWHCHACGADGTAIDLIMLTQNCGFQAALELLARTACITPDARDRSLLRPRTTPARPLPRNTSAPNPHLIDYVEACRSILGTRDGAAVRDWLTRRGFEDPVLAANHVGADPGPARLPRQPGLPRGGPAAVFPVLGRDGTPIYLQVRYLRPGASKYGNPSTDFAGPSPRLAVLRPPTPPADRQTILVCEGIPDGLTAVQAGVRACAVLGAGGADKALAANLAHRYPGRHLVLAFDADDAGRAATERLTHALADHPVTVSSLRLPPGSSDLNDWARSDPTSFPRLIHQTAIPTPVTRHDAPPQDPPR